MSNKVIKWRLPDIDSLRFNATEFTDFSSRIMDDALVAANTFSYWESVIAELTITLDKDPSLNIAGFYAKLEEVQATKQQVIDIFSKALSLKSVWDTNLAVADKFVRQLKCTLVELPDVSSKKNKELQEVVMYDKCPEVFDFYSFCEITVGWMKILLNIFDKRLELMDSANANLARQINVTEMLSMKGLI